MYILYIYIYFFFLNSFMHFFLEKRNESVAMLVYWRVGRAKMTSELFRKNKCIFN